MKKNRDQVSPPKVLQIELTNACNLRCRHCYGDCGFGKSNELTYSEITGLIEASRELGVQTVVLTGGEPCLRSDLIDISNFAKASGMYVSLNTNGLLLSNNLLSNMRASGVDLVSVSLHSTKASAHDAICGKGSHGKVLDAIGRIIECDVPLGISFVICRLNHTEVDLIYYFAVALGAAQISAFRFLSIGRGAIYSYDLAVDNATHKAAVRRIGSIARRLRGVRLSLEAPFFTPNLIEDDIVQVVRCVAGTDVCIVTSIGDVIPCSGLRALRCIAGNIRLNSFKNIWLHSTVFSQLRHFQNNLYRECQPCSICELLDLCRAGCRASALITSGHLFGFDENCWLNTNV